MCGAGDAEIKRFGRWISEVYQKYVGEGRHGMLDAIMDGIDEDVRYSFFPIL
jgi:hypothetical protein